MRKNKMGKLYIGILVAVIALGVGYAIITPITFIISGTARAAASGRDSDFIVHFDDFVDGENYITYSETSGVGDSLTQNVVSATNVVATSSTTTKEASITLAADKKSATIDVSNMTDVGDEVTLKIPVINESDGIGAELSTVVSNNNGDYFTIESTPGVSTLNGNSATSYVSVVVRVIKVPKVNDVTGTFNVTLTADPV